MAKTTRTAKKTTVKKTTKKVAKRKAARPKAKTRKGANNIIPNKRPVRKKTAEDPSRILGIPISLSILSPARFPIDYDRLMIQTARFAGLFFVASGVLFTSIHLPNASQHITETMSAQSLLATVQETDTRILDAAGSMTTTDTKTDTDTTDVIKTENLSEADLTTDFNKDSSGSNTTTGSDTTTSTSNSGSSNTSDNTSIDKQPDVTMHVSQNTSDIFVKFEVAYADSIVVKVVTSSGLVETLGKASEELSGVWSFSHTKVDLKESNYTIFAEVTNQYGSYKTDRINIFIESTGTAESLVTNDTSKILSDGTIDTTDVSVVNDQILVDEAETTTVNEQDEVEPTELTEVLVKFEAGSILSDKVLVKARALGAESVGFYVEPESSASPIFLGAAKKVDQIWVYEWDTRKNPDGNYRFFAIAKNSLKRLLSNGTLVSVKNNVATTDTFVKDSTEIDTEPEYADTTRPLLQKEITADTNEEEIISTESNELKYDPILSDDVEAEDIFEIEKQVTAERETLDLLQRYKTDFDAEVKSLREAVESGDENQIQYSINKLNDLKNFVLDESAADVTDGSRQLVEAKLAEEIHTIESNVRKTEEIVKKRIGEAVTTDTDNDGITDFDEINIYKTDPNVADSDADGVSDSDEILAGFDPINSSKEAVVQFESPKERGIVREDLLVVEKIERAPEPSDNETEDNAKPLAPAVVNGKGLPNSYVTLYIYSTPTIVTVKTEADGSWSYRFDKELEDGEHQVYVGVTDNAGKIVAKSEPLRFVKTAEAFSPVASAADQAPSAPTVTATKAPDLFTDSVIWLILSVSLILIGLLLLLLGLFLHTRKQDTLITANYAANPTL